MLIGRPIIKPDKEDNKVRRRALLPNSDIQEILEMLTGTGRIKDFEKIEKA